MNNTTTVSIETDPNMELQIGEVAHVTGYNPFVLRRLDKEGKIPPSHRVDGTRYWFASEVQKIVEYREKMKKGAAKRMQSLYLSGNRARRAKAKAKAPAAVGA